MPIEFNCSQCASVLRVPDEHAGKQAKCPSCNSVNVIPAANAAPTMDIPASAGTPPSGSYTGVPSSPSGGAFNAPMGNAYSSPQFAPRGNWEAHRGGLILTLGIFGLVCNFMAIPGIMAWLMGSADLKKIQARTMDPEGESLTRAGMIMGIIGTCLAAVGFVFFLLYIVMIVLVVGGAAAGNM